MVMDLTLIGVDHGSEMKYDLNLFPKTELYLIEFPLTQTDSCSSFSLLNDDSQPYFNSKEEFIKKINDYFYENFGVKIIEQSLSLIYDIRDKCDLIYPIGCLNDISFFDSSLENLLRFNRSVNITKNIIETLANYQTTIDLRISELEKKYELFMDPLYLKKNYVHGKKMNLLNNFFSSLINYPGLLTEEITPSVAQEILSDTASISTFGGNNGEELFINPYTISKSFYNAKKNNCFNFPINSASIIIGGPHLKFVENFVSQKFPINQVIDLVDNSSKRLYDSIELDNEIRIAKENQLV